MIFLLATVTLQPFADLRRRRAADHRPGRAARVPDPDDDRRPAVGHRHRRHGPHGAAQRAGHERPGGRGRRGLLHAAAGQDRAPSPSATARPTRFVPLKGVTEGELADAAPALEPRRRDARGALDRGAGQGAVRAAGARSVADAHLVAFTAQTRMSGLDIGGRRSARAPPTRSAAGSRSSAGRSRRGRRDRRRHRLQGGTPLVVAEAARGPHRPPAPWGSSTSRTS